MEQNELPDIGMSSPGTQYVVVFSNHEHNRYVVFSNHEHNTYVEFLNQEHNTYVVFSNHQLRIDIRGGSVNCSAPINYV